MSDEVLSTVMAKVVNVLNSRPFTRNSDSPQDDQPLTPIIKEFKKRRRLWLRQRQKAVILLVKRTKMLVLHMRHACLNISPLYSSKLQREMNKFKVLTTMWTNYSESFSLTLYFKSVLTNPVIGHFAHIV